MPKSLITKVEIDEKCFKNFKGPFEPFEQYNIIFGQNGHGKSTLAKSLISTALSSGHQEEDIRIYNAQYIEESLKLKDEPGKLKSVKAYFGKANTKIEEEVERYEGEIASLNFQLNDNGKAKGLLSLQHEDLSDIQTAIKQIHTENKGSTSVKLKFSQTNSFEMGILEHYRDDYEQGLKKFDDEVIRKSSGNDDHDADLMRVSNIAIDQVDVTNLLEEQAFENAATLLGKTYSSGTPGTEELEWLIKGVGLHVDETECKFCGSYVDIKDVRKRIEVAKQHTKIADMAKLKVFAESLKQYIFVAESLERLNSVYTELYLNPAEQAEDLEALEGSIIVLKKLYQMTKNKLEDNDKTYEASWELALTSAYHIEEISAYISKLKKDSADKITTRINLQNDLVKAKIGYEVINNEIIENKKNSYESRAQIIIQLMKEITEKREKIKELKSQKSQIANFSNYVNNVLASLGFDFKLVADSSDKSYELRHLGNDPIVIEDISEGERNLLALLYFYFEMLDDNEKSVKPNISLIVIDDPIASLDDNNRFYILETVKSLLVDNSSQVFVFTHLWESFTDLCFGKNGRTDTRIYELIKSDGSSSLHKSNTQAPPYKRIYSEIWKLSQTPIANISSSEMVHLPNSMRRSLEEYFGFYAGIRLVNNNAKEEMAKALLDEDYSKLSQHKRRKLTVLLSVTNILSHRIPGNPSATEIHESAKFYMNSMSENHKHHHDKMKI